MSANEGNSLWPRFLASLLPGILVVGLTACGGGGGGGGGGAGVVDPKNSDAVMQALGVKLGDTDATREEDDSLPAPSSDAASPKVTNVPSNNSVSPGEEKAITVDTEQASPLSVLYAKVTGASSRFRAAVASTSALRKQASTSSLSLSFAIPGNLGAGEFCVELAVEDEAGRVSEAATSCFRYTPEGKEPAAIQAALQGVWERCDDGLGERFSFDGTTLVVDEAQFDNANCNGTPTASFTETFDLAIGQPFIADSGQTVNPVDATVTGSDDPQAVGQTFLDLVFIENSGDAFRLGVESAPETRPTAIDFQTPPFRRPQTSDVPRSEQVWEQSVSGTVDGQSFSGITSQVSGEEVPFEEPSEEQFTVEEVVPPQQGQSCDSGSFEGEINISDIVYSFTGDGSVGSVVDLSFSFSVNGSCEIDGEPQDISSSGNLSFRFERLE